MIQYTNRGLATIVMLFHMHGSVFPRASMMAALSTVLSVLLLGAQNGWFDSEGRRPLQLPVQLTHPFGTQIYAIILGLCVVFRTNMALGRYREGMANLQLMTSKWADAFMQVSAFVNSSVACGVAPENLYAWREQMAHWFSLMSAMAIMTLRGPLSGDLECKSGVVTRDIMPYKATVRQAWDLIPNESSPHCNKSVTKKTLKTTNTCSSMASSDVTPIGGISLTRSRKTCDPRSQRSSLQGRRSLSYIDASTLKELKKSSFSKACEEFWKSCRPGHIRDWFVHNWPVHTSRLEGQAVDIPVLQSITPEEEALLMHSEDKVLVVCGWLVASLTRKMHSGHLKVPPPICSRCYQELSNGMLGFNQAMKVAVVPFPFPFAQMLSLLLVGFVLTCPVAVLQFTQSAIFTPVLNFVAVLGYWGLNEIACELENPFGDDPNDLPVMEIHHDFLSAIEEQFISHPHLPDQAQMTGQIQRAPEQAEAQSACSAPVRAVSFDVPSPPACSPPVSK